MDIWGSSGWIRSRDPRITSLTLTLILGEGVNYLTLRVQFYANEWKWWGAAPTYTEYARGGVNYLTLRVHSTLTSATRGETLTPNPNECHSMLTSAIRGIYPYPLDLSIYLSIYIASESSMILSILRLNHPREQSMVELWLVVESQVNKTLYWAK